MMQYHQYSQCCHIVSMFLTTVLIRILLKAKECYKNQGQKKLTTCFVPLTVNFFKCTKALMP